MAKVTPVRGAEALVARLVHDLSDQQDPVALVEAAAAALVDFLHSEWSVVVSGGESALGELMQVQGDVRVEEILRDLGFSDLEEEQRVKVSVGEHAGGFHLRLLRRGHLSVALGPVQGTEVESWRQALLGVAHYLSGRLGDIMETRRVFRANKALERRISDLSLLFKGLDITLSSVELIKVLRAFLACVTSGEAIGFNRAFLLLLDEDASELRGIAAVGPSSGEEEQII